MEVSFLKSGGLVRYSILPQNIPTAEQETRINLAMGQWRLNSLLGMGWLTTDLI